MKILAGPLNMTFVTDMFRQGLEDHEVLLFHNGAADLKFEYPSSRFEDVLEQMPSGWEPDLVIWWLPEFQTVLPGIENCPYPTLALVSDWHVVSDPLFPILKMFDLVGTDLRGLDLLKDVQGVKAFHAPLYGFNPNLHRKIDGVEKIYDVSHVGDLNPYLHIDRVRATIQASIGLQGHSVRFFEHVYGQDYATLLNQSRITINFALRGEMSMRCYEAPACGSLLFCEDFNREVPTILKDREECVLYNSSNLVELLQHYLDHPEECERVALAGYQKIQDYSNQKQGNRCLEKAVGLLEKRDRSYHQLGAREKTLLYSDYCANVTMVTPPFMAKKVCEDALGEYPDESLLHNNLGKTLARFGDLAEGVDRFDYFNQAIEHFRKALDLGLVAYCNLASTHLRNFQPKEASEVLQEAQRPEVGFQNVTIYPRVLSPQWVLWEKDRAGRENIARWRLFELLAELEPENAVEHLTRCTEFKPELATPWFLRGMHRSDDAHKAIEDLERACAIDPSFVCARESLVRALEEDGRESEAAEIAADTQRIYERFPVHSLKPNKPATLRKKLGFFSFVQKEIEEDLLSYARSISFRWLPPDRPYPPQVRELWGKGLEFSNTVFSLEHEATVRRLLKLQLVPRMSTMAVAAVIQRAVALMPEELSFVNVGVWHGFSFLASLLDNGSKKCIGVDNFSQFGGPEAEFRARYEALKGPAHEFHSMDYKEYFEKVHQGKLGVYFYDGEHSYENQLMGLEVAQPYFAPGCIILVDDTNWQDPRRATLDFMSAHRGEYELLFDVKTADTRHITWWNGLMILRYKGG